MTILPDLRFAIRSLRRTPLFTAAAVVSLTLGIAIGLAAAPAADGW